MRPCNPQHFAKGSSLTMATLGVRGIDPPRLLYAGIVF